MTPHQKIRADVLEEMRKWEYKRNGYEYLTESEEQLLKKAIDLSISHTEKWARADEEIRLRAKMRLEGLAMIMGADNKVEQRARASEKEKIYNDFGALRKRAKKEERDRMEEILKSEKFKLWYGKQLALDKTKPIIWTDKEWLQEKRYETVESHFLITYLKKSLGEDEQDKLNREAWIDEEISEQRRERERR